MRSPAFTSTFASSSIVHPRGHIGNDAGIFASLVPPPSRRVSVRFSLNATSKHVPLTLGLVILHLIGVAVASGSHRENLVKAMFTGYKRQP